MQAAIAQAFGVGMSDEGPMATGPGYLAHFDTQGVTIQTPLEGADPQPLRLELSAIRRGDRIVFEPSGQAAPLTRGQTVVYAHGSGIEERYEAQAQGIAQSFVFEEPLVGSGPLVVEFDLDTDLVADVPRSSGSGILFEHAGRGGVHIGEVTGIDAAQARAPGGLAIVDGKLELTLPEAFVDDAAYPLVLDPLIGGSFRVGDPAWSETAQDIAWEQDGSLYLVVWTRFYSLFNTDLLAQRISTGGLPTGPLIVLEGSSLTLTGTAAVAASGPRDHFFVAWSSFTSGFGWDIAGRTVRSTGATSLSSVIPITSGGADEIHPDVGGSNAGLTGDVVVVWEESGSRILARAVLIDSVGTPSTPFFANPLVSLSTTAADRVERPAISKAGGINAAYLVAWEEFFNSPAPGDHDLWSTIIDNRGNSVAPRLALKQTIGPDETFVDVDGGDGEFLAVWSYDSEGTGTDRDIEAAFVEFSGGNATLQTPFFVEANLFDDETFPSVADTGHKYMVAWTDQAGSHDETYLAGVCKDTRIVCEPKSYVFGSFLASTLSTAMAANRSGGIVGANDEATLIWTAQDKLTSGPNAILGQRIEAFGGGTQTNVFGGCGGGGSLRFSGAIAIGNPDFRIELSGVTPAATSALLLVNFGTAALLQCGPCRVDTASNVRIGVVVSGGEATVNIGIPGDPSLEGIAGTVQGLIVNSPGPCGRFPKFSASNRQHFTLTY